MNSYLQLVASARRSNTRLSAADTHVLVQRSPEGSAAYRAHLRSRGVAKAAPGTMRLTAPRSPLSRLQLRADRVDAAAGVISGATVAQAGVEATGKTVFVDRLGCVTRDERAAVCELPVWTDDRTLETLLAAASHRVKTRQDHDDSVGARAGFTDNFRRVGDRVIGDVHLFENYANRGVVLETATQAPSQIGLSIDFEPAFEIRDGKALMRVVRLDAVDIVDEGAITHRGLF